MKYTQVIAAAFALSATCACHKKAGEPKPATVSVTPVSHPKDTIRQQISYPCTVVYTGVLGIGGTQDFVMEYIDSSYSFTVTYLSKDIVIIKGSGNVPYDGRTLASINDTLPNEEYIYGGNLYCKYYKDPAYSLVPAIHYEFHNGTMSASWSLEVYVPGNCVNYGSSDGSFTGVGKKLPRHP